MELLWTVLFSVHTVQFENLVRARTEEKGRMLCVCLAGSVVDRHSLTESRILRTLFLLPPFCFADLIHCFPPVFLRTLVLYKKFIF